MSKFFIEIKQKRISVARTLLGAQVYPIEYRYEVFVNDIYIDTFRTYQQLQDWCLSFQYTSGKKGQIVVNYSTSDCPF